MKKPEPTKLPEPRCSEDLELARRALARDRGAVEALIGRLGCVRRSLTAKNRRFGSPLGTEELEDLLQETLLAIWKNLALYSGAGPLEAWAYRFGYLRLIERIRELDRRPRRTGAVGGGSDEPQARPDGDPFRFEQLYKQLARLGEQDEALVRRKVFDQRTFEQIGAELGMPTNTVKTRFYRSIEKLRGMLESAKSELLQSPEASP